MINSKNEAIKDTEEY